MQDRQSRGDGTRCREGRVLCFAVALWSVKAALAAACPGWDVQYRKSWLPGLAAALFRRKSGLAWAAGARWLQVMRFSFLTFFFVFFFPFPFC